jgi:hypothetical protein
LALSLEIVYSKIKIISVLNRFKDSVIQYYTSSASVLLPSISKKWLRFVFHNGWFSLNSTFFFIFNGLFFSKVRNLLLVQEALNNFHQLR